MNDHYSKWNHQWRRIFVWSRNQTIVNPRSFWSSHSDSPLFAPKHQTQNNAWVVCWKIHHLVRWFSSFKPPFSSDMKIGISPRILVWHCLTSSMKDRTVSVLVNSASFNGAFIRVKGKKLHNTLGRSDHHHSAWYYIRDHKNHKWLVCTYCSCNPLSIHHGDGPVL